MLQRMLRDTSELDYGSHVVFRMYEDVHVDPEDPDRCVCWRCAHGHGAC